MAFYIPMSLDSRNGTLLTYAYTQPQYAPDPARANRRVEVGQLRGLVSYNQASREFKHVLGSDWDDGTYYQRVCAKLRKHFESGDVPESTAYAA